MLNTQAKKIIFLFFFIIFLFYFFSQLKVFFLAPDLPITDFENQSHLIVKKSPYILKAKAKNFKKVYINSEEVFLNPDGELEKKIFLQKGENKIFLEAVSKNNKKFKRTLSIYLIP